jgi:hypothetical protein
MRNDLMLATEALPRGGLRRITDGRGLLLLCLEGRLWLTQEGDARDIVLEPGQTARVEHGGLAIVQALRDARLQLLGNTAQAAPH